MLQEWTCQGDSGWGCHFVFALASDVDKEAMAREPCTLQVEISQDEAIASSRLIF
jgi:hypothetical protein